MIMREILRFCDLDLIYVETRIEVIVNPFVFIKRVIDD